jgi:hypothetical protein
MIAPNSHLGHLSAAPKEVTDEMMDLLKRSQRAPIDVYNPEVQRRDQPWVVGGWLGDHPMHILPDGEATRTSSKSVNRIPRKIIGNLSKQRKKICSMCAASCKIPGRGISTRCLRAHLRNRLIFDFA